MSVECQVNIKSQSELDIGGRETCSSSLSLNIFKKTPELTLCFWMYPKWSRWRKFKLSGQENMKTVFIFREISGSF